MTGGILDVADVMRGDGDWTAGFQFDAIGCALNSQIYDICNPVAGDVPLTRASEDPEAPSSGREGFVFAVVTSLKTRAMCSPGNEDSIVDAAMDAESEKAVAKVLEDGAGGSADVFLDSPDVETVTAGASTAASIAKLLAAFWARATGLGGPDTILHLGVNKAMDIPGQWDALEKVGIAKVSISPGYSPDLLAVTGPIAVRLGTTQVLTETRTRDNDNFAEATRLASVEFDPCTAVRIG